MPEEYGSVTPSAAAVATAASAAVPPRRRTWIPIAGASGSTPATAPPKPGAPACPGGATPGADPAGFGMALAAIAPVAPADAETGRATSGIARASAPRPLRTDVGIVTSSCSISDRGPDRFRDLH